MLLVVLGVVAQVAPFLWSGEPAPAPPEAAALAEAGRYAQPVPAAALAKRLTAWAGLALVLASGLAVAAERRWGDGPLRWPARLGLLAAVYGWVWLLGLPFGIAHFLHMREFGLTDLTLGGRFRVAALAFPVPFVTFLMVYLLIYCCMPLLSRRWWIGGAVLVLVFFHLIPEWVSRAQPLDPVETLTRLEAGAHHEALREVAVQAGMPELAFYTVDQSRRSNQVNMYLTGRLGREYVVLTDTMLDRLDPAESAVILAHELGHGETRHVTVPLLKAAAVLKLLLALYLAHLLLGRGPVAPARRLQALVLVMLTVRVVSFAFLPATSALSRYREREADRYALELTGRPEVFAQAVLKTAEINLEPWELPRWVRLLSGTHPSVRERLAAAREAGR